MKNISEEVTQSAAKREIRSIKKKKKRLLDKEDEIVSI